MSNANSNDVDENLLAACQHAAKFAHEVDRVYCMAMGDHVPLPWDEAPEWQRLSVINGALNIAQNPFLSPEQSHENWLNEMDREGWEYAPEYNGKTKSHPRMAMVPYAMLSAEHHMKDMLFIAAVRSVLGDRLPAYRLPAYSTPEESTRDVDDDAGTSRASGPAACPVCNGKLWPEVYEVGDARLAREHLACSVCGASVPLPVFAKRKRDRTSVPLPMFAKRKRDREREAEERGGSTERHDGNRDRKELLDVASECLVGLDQTALASLRLKSTGDARTQFVASSRLASQLVGHVALLAVWQMDVGEKAFVDADDVVDAFHAVSCLQRLMRRQPLLEMADTDPNGDLPPRVTIEDLVNRERIALFGADEEDCVPDDMEERRTLFGETDEDGERYGLTERGIERRNEDEGSLGARVEALEQIPDCLRARSEEDEP